MAGTEMDKIWQKIEKKCVLNQTENWMEKTLKIASKLPLIFFDDKLRDLTLACPFVTSASDKEKPLF